MTAQVTQRAGADRRERVRRRARRGRRSALCTSAALVLGALASPLTPPALAQALRPAPVDLQLRPGAASIAAAWGVSSTVEPSGFRVRWRKQGGGGGGHVELPRGARSFTITGLRQATYEVLVRGLYEGHAGAPVLGEATPLPVGEEARKEERSPPPAATVSPTPDGPSTPVGGWSVAYADAFGEPLGAGAGHDNTFFPNNCSKIANCSGFNSNEMEVMNPSAAVTTAEGLKLTCTYSATAVQPGSKHYVCGTLRGMESLSGYRSFKWSPGKGQTLVFQAIAKLPPNTGEADPGWWSNGPPWSDTEVDFFEGGGWDRYTSGWKTNPLYTAWFASPHPSADKEGFATDPSAAFHTYTFEIAPNDAYSVWIDGALQLWAANVGPVKPDLAEKATLILSYALRTCASCHTGFTSGTREFDVKSVAVYEDAGHKGVGVEGEGLAPGTAIG